MGSSKNTDAWNKFVLNSEWADYSDGDIRRSAAIAKSYMGLANNGGINSFLTNTWELSAGEVLGALKAVGALYAASEFEMIVGALMAPVPVMTQDERWEFMEKHWRVGLNQFDMLSDEADEDLMNALEKHVQANEAFYFALE